MSKAGRNERRAKGATQGGGKGDGTRWRQHNIAVVLPRPFLHCLDMFSFSKLVSPKSLNNILTAYVVVAKVYIE